MILGYKLFFQLMRYGGVVAVAILIVFIPQLLHWTKTLLPQLLPQAPLPTHAPSPTPEADVNVLIVQAVQGASEIVTQRNPVNTVVSVEKPENFASWLPIEVGNTSMLMEVYAEVISGVDLSTFSAENIVEEPDGTRIIKLPHPHILEISLDPDRVVLHSFNSSGTASQSAAFELQQAAMSEAKEEIRLKVCDWKLLEGAGDRAKLTLEKLLQLVAGNQPIRVEILEQGPNACQDALVKPEG